MAVLPGSLDYLYHNGILPRIPYEAYEMTPMTPSGQAQFAGMGMGYGFNASPMYGAVGMSSMNGTQYLNQAQRGLMYNTYTCPDTFVRRNNKPIEAGEGYSIKKAFIDGEGYGRDLNAEGMALGEDTKGIRKSFSKFGAKVKNSVVNAPDWAKGLAAGGIMLGTLACLFRGKKAPIPPHAPEKSLFEKFTSLFKK